MPDHSYYEELTALAAGGHLSPEEADDLRVHLARCAECRESAQAFHELVSSGLSLTLSDASIANVRVTANVDANARDRFLARARNEGVQFSAEVEPRATAVRWSLAYRVAAGIAFAAVVIGGVFYTQRIARGSDAQVELDRVRSENVRLNETLTARDRELADQQATLQKLQAQLAGAVHSSARPNDQPGFQLGQSRSFEARLLEEIQNRDKQLAAAAEEISRINQLRVTDRAALDAEGTRLKEALNQLRIARATIDVERELAAAGRDIMTLMAAKQLRVVDVRDTDASGQPSAAFARVFITENLVRVFAFDMNEGATGTPRRFQVWGEQLGDARSVRSLGTLDIDDRTQNRWSLTLQNADVVKNINSVFVTTAGRGNAPDGARLLYAFLGRS